MSVSLQQSKQARLVDQILVLDLWSKLADTEVGFLESFDVLSSTNIYYKKFFDKMKNDMLVDGNFNYGVHIKKSKLFHKSVPYFIDSNNSILFGEKIGRAADIIEMEFLLNEKVKQNFLNRDDKEKIMFYEYLAAFESFRLNSNIAFKNITNLCKYNRKEILENVVKNLDNNGDNKWTLSKTIKNYKNSFNDFVVGLIEESNRIRNNNKELVSVRDYFRKTCNLDVLKDERLFYKIDKKIEFYNLWGTLSSLMPVHHSLKIASIVGYPDKDIVDNIVRDVDDGETLYGSLRSQKDYFPKFITALVEAGEYNADLPKNLHNISSYLARESRLKSMLK